MDEQIDKVIQSIIYLPFEFGHQNKSLYTLLQESGYFELYNQINDDRLLEILKQHPKSIEYWLV